MHRPRSPGQKVPRLRGRPSDQSPAAHLPRHDREHFSTIVNTAPRTAPKCSRSRGTLFTLAWNRCSPPVETPFTIAWNTHPPSNGPLTPSTSLAADRQLRRSLPGPSTLEIPEWRVASLRLQPRQSLRVGIPYTSKESAQRALSDLAAARSRSAHRNAPGVHRNHLPRSSDRCTGARTPPSCET